MEINDVGAVYGGESSKSSFVNKVVNKVICLKAIRRVGNYLGLELYDHDISLISAVYMWTEVMGNGGSIDRIIGWTGYSSAWKAQMYKSKGKCLELGLLYNKPVQRGNRIQVSQKGIRVLETYGMMIEKVSQEELMKAASGKIYA